MHFYESSLYNHDQSTDFFDKQKFKKSKENCKTSMDGKTWMYYTNGTWKW